MWFDAIEYLCHKIGISISFVRNETSDCHFIYARHHPIYAGCIFGKTVKLMPNIRYMQTTKELEFTAYSSKHMLDSFLKTQTFAVDSFIGRIGNPWFQHLELLECKNLEEFKIRADLVFPDDISGKVFAFFMNELKTKGR